MGFLDRKNVKEENQEFAGLSFNVIKAPRPQKKNFFKRVLLGLQTLIGGMRVTFGYVSKPSSIVTQQYPENRDSLKLAERYRAQLRLKYNEDGLHNCTGCKICDTHCPNNSIDVIDKKGLSKKKEIDRYIWHMDTCTFCNICVQVCPFDALEMTHDFESSVFDRRTLVYQLNHYSGPAKKILDKMELTKDDEGVMIPRSPYDGPVPLGERTYSPETEESSESKPESKPEPKPEAAKTEKKDD